MTEQAEQPKHPNPDAYISHLESQVHKLSQELAEVRQAYEDGDRYSQLRGWAIDRALKPWDGTGKAPEVEEVLMVASQYIDYCSQPHWEAIQKAQAVCLEPMKGAA